MSLSTYVKKRDFTKTSEPKADKSNNTKPLRFVIQKHAASHLHYDFRLEMGGVLKSWAVPKGPSTDPSVKRLAMMVEDHPFSYRTFEGIIPEGQYGGGTVIVWDEGTYEPIEKIEGKKAQEKYLLRQLKEGSLKFVLKGKKLRGEFALVKTHGMDENSWLLIKHRDQYASKNDIGKQDESVLSGKTLGEVAKSPGKVWESKRASEWVKPTEKKGKRATFPKNLKPMLATLVDEPFDDPGWLYEIKWDGYRALGMVNKGKVELLSRNRKSFNDKFYPVTHALQNWKENAVIDGEIVVLNKNGLSDFSALQNWRSEADGDLVYYVFDLLWLNGRDLTDLPLTDRRAILESLLPTHENIRLSKTFDTGGTEFFKAADRIGLEGIVAKKADSAYASGIRSKEWLKIKTVKRQEIVIGGFTRNEGGRTGFSSLMMGVYEGEDLVYSGLVGTGFTHAMQNDILERMQPFITNKCPFASEPDYNKPSRFRPNPPKAKATWLKPALVGEISYREMTNDGVMRHPSFKGLREDKDAKQVVREIPRHTEALAEEDQTLIHKKIVAAEKSNVRKTLLNPKEETQIKTICGHELKFTNLSKLFWPEDAVTKRDMLNYYYQAASFILPYLEDRPQSLNRFPNGIHGKSFYQKNVSGKAPGWIVKFPYLSQEAGEEKREFLVGSDESSLLYMASLGSIEMNPWFSRIQSPDYPDYCVIDIDPDRHSFDQVIEVALMVKQILDAINVVCYCKTSGSAGMHVYIPLGAKYTYDQSQLFGRMLATLVQKELPELTTIERTIRNREGKLYLDFLQNRPQATLACPYSLRPKPGATVSMPLHWEEVRPGLTMRQFSIFNAIDRMRAGGDLFKGVLGEGIDLEKAVKKAKETF